MSVKGFGMVSRSKGSKKLRRVIKIIAVLPIIFISAAGVWHKKKN